MKQFFDWIDQCIQHRNFALIILGFVTISVFINILPNHFIMDDFDFIVRWDLIKDIKNLPRFFIGYIPPETQVGIYSPLRTLAFSLNYMVFHENPLGWHIVSILIHLVGVWAVYCLTQLLVGNRWLSFLTALLFAVHPVHGESVTSITGSIDTIGIVLGLWSFYWYIRSALPSDQTQVFTDDGALYQREGIEERNTKYYWTSFVLGVLAIGTHELILSLPVLLFMFDFLFLHPRYSWKRSILRVLPFFGVAVLYVCAKAGVLGSVSRGTYIFDDPYRTFLVVIKAWAKYLGVLLVPLVLTHNKMISKGVMSYNHNDFDQAAFFAQSWRDPEIILSFGILLGLFLVGIFFLRKKPLVSFCIFWFYISLLPVSQIIPGPAYYAERYLYLGSWAYCLIIAWIFLGLYQKYFKASRCDVLGITLISLVVVLYGMRTMIRNRDWKDWITFYEQTVKNNPQSAYLKNDLGIRYMRSGKFRMAERSLVEALEMQPENDYFYFSIAEVYAKSDQKEQVIRSLKKAFELDPEFAEAYFNLAGASAFYGNEKQGIEYLEKAVDLWRTQGRIFEAGEAMSTFFVFLADQKDLLNKKIQQDLMQRAYTGAIAQ